MADRPGLLGGILLVQRLRDKGLLEGPWKATDKAWAEFEALKASERGTKEQWIQGALGLLNVSGIQDVETEFAIARLLEIEAEML